MRGARLVQRKRPPPGRAGLRSWRRAPGDGSGPRAKACPAATLVGRRPQRRAPEDHTPRARAHLETQRGAGGRRRARGGLAARGGTMTNAWRSAGLAAVAAIVLAGCGDDDKNAAAAPPQVERGSADPRDPVRRRPGVRDVGPSDRPVPGPRRRRRAGEPRCRDGDHHHLPEHQRAALHPRDARRARRLPVVLRGDAAARRLHLRRAEAHAGGADAGDRGDRHEGGPEGRRRWRVRVHVPGADRHDRSRPDQDAHRRGVDLPQQRRGHRRSRRLVQLRAGRRRRAEARDHHGRGLQPLPRRPHRARVAAHDAALPHLPLAADRRSRDRPDGQLQGDDPQDPQPARRSPA